MAARCCPASAAGCRPGRAVAGVVVAGTDTLGIAGAAEPLVRVDSPPRGEVPGHGHFHSGAGAERDRGFADFRDSGLPRGLLPDPGVLEEGADCAAEYGLRARRDGERNHLPRLDQLAQRGEPSPEPRDGERGGRSLVLLSRTRFSAVAVYICMCSSGRGGGGQKRLATPGWSKSERKTLIPSTIEVLRFTSSAVQSFRYHRSIAPTVSGSPRPIPWPVAFLAKGIPSSVTRPRSPASRRQVATSPPGAGVRCHRSSAWATPGCAPRGIKATSGYASSASSWPPGPSGRRARH